MLKILIALFMLLNLASFSNANELGDGKKRSEGYEPITEPVPETYWYTPSQQEEFESLRLSPADRGTTNLVSQDICPGKRHGHVFVLPMANTLGIFDRSQAEYIQTGSAKGSVFDFDGPETKSKTASKGKTAKNLKRDNLGIAKPPEKCKIQKTRKPQVTTATYIEFEETIIRQCPDMPEQKEVYRLVMQAKEVHNRKVWTVKTNVFNPKLKKQIQCSYTTKVGRS